MAIRNLQPVIWTNGALLSPQQLQQQDRYLEDISRFHWNMLAFRPWGFRTLSLDHESLSNGIVSIAAAAGIFADGLAFDIPESDAAPPPIPLAGAGESTQALDVFLTIPQFRARGANLAGAGPDRGARFHYEASAIIDENAGKGERPVQVAARNFRLMAGAGAPEGMSSLRLARVRRTAAGSWECDPGFVPPLLDFAAGSWLNSILRRLVEILTSRSAAISSARRERRRSLADFTAGEVPDFWLLYTINTWLPVFRHLFESRKGHPDRLFAAMTQFAATLTAFSNEARVSDLPVYDHENAGGCFTELDRMLRQLLERAAPRNCVSLPLREVRPSIYATAIDDDRCLAARRVYLAIRSGGGRNDLATRAPELVKLCSSNHIERLVRQALPGARLTHAPALAEGAAVRLGFEYFSVEQSGPAWETVVRSRNLAAYVPSDLADPELELLILLPEAA
jgi:type VI secretion system protein ImpJ